MDLGLAGRRALVTAASKGLGRACATTLIAEGARVFISSRSPEATAREIGAIGFLAADIADESAPERIVQAAVGALGGLDIVVVNAGISTSQTWDAVTPQLWEATLATNLSGAWYTCQVTAPHLAAAG
ncbi:MAG TPA: SDR family NAD(P)-dependent oxidoreductase, partial [Candidatus Acidoferrum sp.]|nr:SDR family NAD(P)-dependent oxidoreductase [Candidatus Acidoferrum sp.]